MTEQIEINTLYNLDCLDGMKMIKEQGIKIDCVITDPPYGIKVAKNGTWGGGKGEWSPTQFKKVTWDNERPKKEYFDLMREISDNQIIFGGNYFADMLPATSCYIVWDKRNGTTNFADCELAWASFPTPVRKIEYLWNGYLQGNMQNKETRIHPTQKPLPVMEWIINKYTKEGDLILDPFMGSGTTMIACHKLKRRYIGFELDKDYFIMAKDRLEQEKAQLTIFDL